MDDAAAEHHHGVGDEPSFRTESLSGEGIGLLQLLEKGKSLNYLLQNDRLHYTLLSIKPHPGIYGIWQDVVKARYLRNQTVATVEARFNDSPCWKNLLKIKDLYMIGRRIHTGSGDLARLWKDSINGLTPFMDQYPRLYNICVAQNYTLDKLENVVCADFFRRRLDDDLTKQWMSLQSSVRRLNLSGDKDSVYWGLNKSGLQAGEDIKQLRAGAEMIRNGTMLLMRACDASNK